MRNLNESSAGNPTRRRVRLSGRERSVLKLVGHANIKKVIAEKLGISEHTVKRTMDRLYAATGIERGYMSHQNLAQWAREHEADIEGDGECEVPELPRAA